MKFSPGLEIVFHRSSARHYVFPPPITSIEQVDCVKLLGVYFNDKLSFCPHVNHLLTALNQRFYLLGQRRRRGLIYLSQLLGRLNQFLHKFLRRQQYKCGLHTPKFQLSINLTNFDRYYHVQVCPTKGPQRGLDQNVKL